MIIMIAFPHGENGGGNPTVPSTVAGRVGPLSNHVTKGIDAESGVLNHNDPGNTGINNHPEHQLVEKDYLY